MKEDYLKSICSEINCTDVLVHYREIENNGMKFLIPICEKHFKEYIGKKGNEL